MKYVLLAVLGVLLAGLGFLVFRSTPEGQLAPASPLTLARGASKPAVQDVAPVGTESGPLSAPVALERAAVVSPSLDTAAPAAGPVL